MNSTAASLKSADPISPGEAAKWACGASDAGYHYMGCAKALALMGKSFAEAYLEMLKGRNGPCPVTSSPIVTSPSALKAAH